MGPNSCFEILCIALQELPNISTSIKGSPGGGEPPCTTLRFLPPQRKINISFFHFVCRSTDDEIDNVLFLVVVLKASGFLSAILGGACQAHGWTSCKTATDR